MESGVTWSSAFPIEDEGARLKVWAGPTLTAREQRAMELVASGETDERIACLMDVSVGSARYVVRTAMAKLGASTRPHAVYLAIVSGVLPVAQGEASG